MADTTRYQVRSAAVIVPVADADGAEVMRTLYASAVFDGDPNHYRIKHNVDAGYIAEIGEDDRTGVDGAGRVLLNDETLDDNEPGAPVVPNDPGTVNEAAHQASVESRAKADADAREKANNPDENADSKGVKSEQRKGGRPSAEEKNRLVEDAVKAGLSRAEAEKATVPELRAALNP